MNSRQQFPLLYLSFLFLFPAMAVAQIMPDSIAPDQNLQDAVVRTTRSNRAQTRTENVELISSAQLRRAACCNLGESFTASPSVDVTYADAATGARQIKLLGLDGTYVQMLTENVPNLRGAAIPYSLGYVPGPWMQSIQVSKGASSVRNGYESTTGQINIEYLKPQAEDGVRANGYFDSQLRTELNADGNIHLSDRLSTSLLLHFEDRRRDHDGNHDGFMDMPKLRQYNLMHRWAYVGPQWISQFSVRLLHDEREGGMSRHADMATHIPHYGILVDADRYEAQWKNGFTFSTDQPTSVALMLHGSWQDTDSRFGHQRYDVTQRNGYAQLMFERDFTSAHQLSVGASVNHDSYSEWFVPTTAGPDVTPLRERRGGPAKETTAGLYAQYTYRLGDKLTVMPGLRLDHSSAYGSFLTPRLHVKWAPHRLLSLRASAGKGYRSPHALAEHAPLMASTRTFVFPAEIGQEEAWNYGLSASLRLPVAGRTLELNAEYFYTHFLHQLVVNVDGAGRAGTVSFENLSGRSFSHTFQIDATYPFFDGFTAMAAFRYNDARTTYDGLLRRRPFTNRFKGLLTLSYQTPLQLWHFDVTASVAGSGVRYDFTSYPTYCQLQAQVTRDFRHFSLYAGGENLTNYRIPSPVIGADNPWLPGFDATQVWGPTEGAMAYVGIRWHLN